MKWIAFIFCILVLLPISIAVVETAQEVFSKKFKQPIYGLLILLVEAAIFAFLAILPKCDGEELTAPNGKTELEHYEPRF